MPSHISWGGTQNVTPKHRICPGQLYAVHIVSSSPTGQSITPSHRTVGKTSTMAPNAHSMCMVDSVVCKLSFVPYLQFGDFANESWGNRLNI